MAAFALVGLDRQIHLAGAGGVRALTMDLGANPLLWGQHDIQSAAWSWPTWSPDGARLAAIELPSGGEDDLAGPARVQILEQDGLRQRVILEPKGQVPIALSWSPDGEQLGVLLQDEETLSLMACPLDGSRPREVESGAPLFFSWVGAHLLTHAGDPPRVVLHGADEDRLVSDRPGEFCVPLEVCGSLFHVQRIGGLSRLMRTQGGQTEALQVLQGLTAMVPDGDSLLLSTAGGGQGTPYRGVHRMDARSGLSSQLSDEECLAFYPVPGRGGVLMVRVDSARNCLRWELVDSGEERRELAAFWPSRETLWSLQFFEHFALSNPPVDPRGEKLVYAGYPAGADPRRAKAEVFTLDLDQGAPPLPIHTGSFACFPPG